MRATNQTRPAARVHSLTGGIPHLSTGRLWRLMNAPRPVDHRGVRIACIVLLIAYGIAGVVRHDPRHSEFLWIRLAVCLYAVAGLGWALASSSIIAWSGSLITRKLLAARGRPETSDA